LWPLSKGAVGKLVDALAEYDPAEIAVCERIVVKLWQPLTGFSS
jgi:hypothetical protein